MHVWQKNWFLLLTQDGLSGPLADRFTFRCAVSACRQDAALQFRQHISWNVVADKNNGIFGQLSVFWMQKSFDYHLKKIILTKFGLVAVRRSVMAAAFWSKTFWFFKISRSAPASHVLMLSLSCHVLYNRAPPKVWLHCLELRVVSFLLQSIFNQFWFFSTIYIMIWSINMESIDHWLILSVVNSIKCSSKRFGENDSRRTGISQQTGLANQSPLFMQQPMGRG